MENNYLNGNNAYLNGNPDGGCNTPPEPAEPGKNMAVVSLVLGIIGLGTMVLGIGYTAILSVLLGVAGVICASKSKKEGYSGGLRTAGLIISIISIVCGTLVFVACVGCVAALGMMGTSDGFWGALDWLSSI